MADLPSDRSEALVRNEVQTAAGGLVVQVGTINGDAYFNGSPGPGKHDELTLISDEFAAGVRKRWLEEERRRKVRDPASLPVRWVAADDALMDHWANICLTRVGEEAEPLDLAGQLDEIAGIYGRIPSGRLVLLGRDGSGKTVLGLRLVLDLLKSRRSGEPVPEMFSIGSWEPTVEPLTKWLSDQLCRDQPGLATIGADGETLAAALLGRGLILPVLDGFDEIAAGLRRDALRELSATAGPLVLTSRPAEYTAAGAGTRCLSHAAAIELADLTLSDLKDYLLRSSPKNITPDWLHVLAELHRDPHAEGNANLAAALTTPLMVSLAGTVYGESRDDQHDAIADRPTALLDTNRFRTSRSIEEHLLSTFLPTVYRLRPGDARTAPRHKWEPERAQRWLGNLAVHLDRLGTRNLAWWEFGHSVRGSTRLLVISFLSGLSFAMVTGIGNIPVDLFGTSHGLGFAVRRGIVVGLLHGLVAALAFGFLFRLADGSETLKPSPVRIRLFHRRRPNKAPLTARIAAGALVGFLVALALVLLDRLLVPLLGLDDGLGGGLLSAIVFPLEIGLSAGLAFGLMTWLEAPIDLRAAAGLSDLLRSNRANVIAHFVVWAIVLGTVAGVVNSFTGGVASSLEVALVFGIEGAFGAGLGYGLCLTAWGHWVAIARIWLPLTGRLPWRLVAFLDDACRVGALRRAGAVYQFRHARLQDHLTTR